MLKYLLSRLLSTIPILLAVSILTFLFIHMIPGDPARLIAGEDATEEDVRIVRERLGLDKPLYIQYLVFLKKALKGDFGESLKTRKPVMEEIGARFMPTFTLTLASMVWAIVFGMTLGTVSAIKRSRWQDITGRVSAVAGISLPSFWLGLLLIQICAVELGWLPSSGYGTWKHYILPSMTLGAGIAAVLTRFTRSSLLEVLKEDYIRTARAKGLKEKLVISKHAIKNAMIPVVTMIGLQFGFLLGGSIVVETVFSWPGMGRLMIDSINFRDYPVIQVEMLIFSLEFILINLSVDILYGWLNPKISFSNSGLK